MQNVLPIEWIEDNEDLTTTLLLNAMDAAFLDDVDILDTASVKSLCILIQERTGSKQEDCLDAISAFYIENPLVQKFLEMKGWTDTQDIPFV